MSVSVIESLLETDLSEIVRPFLDFSYLLNVFISVFVTSVSIETVRSIIGKGTEDFSLGYQTETFQPETG